MASGTRRRKRIAARVALGFLAMVLVGAVLGYKAYEPLIVSRWGWTPLSTKLDYLSLQCMHPAGSPPERKRTNC
jgi:hypothetical protein